MGILQGGVESEGFPKWTCKGWGSHAWPSVEWHMKNLPLCLLPGQLEELGSIQCWLEGERGGNGKCLQIGLESWRWVSKMWVLVSRLNLMQEPKRNAAWFWKTKAPAELLYNLGSYNQLPLPAFGVSKSFAILPVIELTSLGTKFLAKGPNSSTVNKGCCATVL